MLTFREVELDRQRPLRAVLTELRRAGAFDLDVLAAMLGQSESQIAQMVDHALAARLLEQQRGPRVHGHPHGMEAIGPTPHHTQH
jgi:hypothetical protein